MRTTTRGRVDGNAFGATLIHLAVKYSKEVSMEGHSYARFLPEFLVLCRVLLTLAGVQDRVAKPFLAGLHEEFSAFNSDYEDLLETRMEHYFEASLKVPSGSNLIQWLVDDWARCLDVHTNVASWAHEVLLEAFLVFMELIGSVPLAVRLYGPRTPKGDK